MLKQKGSVLHPPARIGIVGGGQLGRMLAAAAKQMGHHVTVLDPDPGSPAGQVADRQIVAGFKDVAAIRELVAATDVATYEFEHIDAEVLSTLELEGHSICPSGTTLAMVQDKYVQKTMLKEHGIPVPDFAAVPHFGDLLECAVRFGYPFVLKYRKGGYDGKGNIVVRHAGQLADLRYLTDRKSLMAERYVDFERELSVVAVRSADGRTVLYPIGENVHEQGILRITTVPADIGTEVETRVHDTCMRVLEAISDRGVFCIEMFLSMDGQVLVNEIAPRPHNSGHYTMEACVTSQFEQLIRVMTGQPPGSARLRSPCAMVNILGGETAVCDYRVEGTDKVLAQEDLHVHLYGKSSTAFLRKLGHVTVLDDCVPKAAMRCTEALQSIRIVAGACIAGSVAANGSSGKG